MDKDTAKQQLDQAFKHFMERIAEVCDEYEANSRGITVRDTNAIQSEKQRMLDIIPDEYLNGILAHLTRGDR